MATQKDPITTTTTCSFYELLSLSTNEAGIEEIKKAYRTMALKYHPDVCPNSENAKVFILLNTAYKTLSDPILRKKYDNKMRLGDFGCTYEEEFGNWDLRGRWEDQLLELKSRSSFRVAKKEGSWGCLGFAKVNVSTREVKKHIYGEEKYGGKPLFLPAGFKIEDDGYILSFVHEEKMWKSELQIVNAMSLELETTIELPSLVSYGFPGTFINFMDLKNQA
ncbi:hypothetical protein LguiA_008629 [Lonicera macranthoides]